jgi:hypothetical protein
LEKNARNLLRYWLQSLIKLARHFFDIEVEVDIDFEVDFITPRRGGETGRRAGFRILWPQGLVGSTPTHGTNNLF